MATYESISGTGINTSVTFVAATKPTGLAVGDVMVAGAYASITGITDITSTGWTEITKELIGTTQMLKTLYKVADSADVAASTFSFVRVGTGSGNMGVQIVRVSNFGLIASGADGQNIVASGSTSASISGYTPTRTNCLMIGFVALESGGTEIINTLAIATSNPTWTDRGSITSTIAMLKCFTATRPEITATGNITYTYNDPGTTAQTLASVVSLAPVVNGSVSPTAPTVNAYALSPIQTPVINAIVGQPSTVDSYPTVWTTVTKS